MMQINPYNDAAIHRQPFHMEPTRNADCKGNSFLNLIPYIYGEAHLAY